jgi:lipopolysaccharide transport system permease protein
MQDFSASPREMIASFWRNRQLIGVLVEREVLGRYKGSYFGVLWSFFNPVLMLCVYTFVFSVVFKARWGVGNDSTVEFASVLFIGLIAFNFFAECISRAPSLVLSNPNYVKKVIFPLEILPLVSMGAALIHMLISFLVWLIFYLLIFGITSQASYFFPVALLPLIFITLGISLTLSSLGVYFRDISQVVSLLVTALMFLTPIFYPISILPEQYKFFMAFNPIALSVEEIRNVLIWGVPPDWNNYLSYLATSFFILIIGFFIFQKARKGFADVI